MRSLSISVIVMLAFVSPSMAVNLITNGSFETGNLTGWTVDPFGQGNTTANVYSGVYCCQGATPPDGSFAVAFGGGGAFSGEIAQEFPTVSGHTYTGSLEYAGVGTPDSVVEVTVGDALSFTPILGPVTLTPSFDGVWHTYNFSFVATSALSGIDILGPSDGGCCSDTNVDNVIVTPEPASFGLIGICAAGLLRRRKARQRIRCHKPITWAK